MVSIKKILLLLSFCCCWQHIKSNVNFKAINDQKIAIIKHTSATEGLPDLKNPRSTTISSLSPARRSSNSSYSYSEKNAPKLTATEKREKFGNDKALSDNIKGFVQTDTSLSSVSAAHLATLDEPDITKQAKNYLAERNKTEKEDIMHAKQDYHKQLADFINNTQKPTLAKIKKIENEVKQNEIDISNTQKKLKKTTNSNAQSVQLQETLNHLNIQNHTNVSTIKSRLSQLFNTLHQLDTEFGNRYKSIIQHYKNKDIQMLNTLNRILKTKGKMIQFTTPEQSTSNSSKTTRMIEPEPGEEPTAPFIPSIPLDELAQSSAYILDHHIQTLSNELEAAKKDKNVSGSKIQYLKDKLAYWKKAKVYKNKE